MIVAGTLWFIRSPPASSHGQDVRATPTPKAQPSSDFAAAKSVAVLPFANLSGDNEQEYFTDGLTDEILNPLARERDLRVVPRTSAFSFKGRNGPLADIARALNVARVVEGSVQKAGSRVRIRVTLTRVADQASEALDSIEREYSDIFALQDEVARKVMEKIAGRASPVAAAAPTKNLAAYGAHLRGRAAQTGGSSPALLDAATHHYHDAVRLDSGYALAWARLAEVHVVAVWGSVSRGSEIGAKARAAAAEALKLDPNLPEAHLALRRLGEKDRAAALATELVAQAESRSAQPAAERPEDADQALGVALALAGRAEEAIAAVRRYVDAVSSANRITERWQREAWLARVYAVLGRARECVAVLQPLLRLPSGTTVPMLKVEPTWDAVRDDPAFKALLADPKNSAHFSSRERFEPRGFPELRLARCGASAEN